MSNTSSISASKSGSAAPEPFSIPLNAVFFGVYFAILSFAKGFGLYDGTTSFTALFLAAMLAWALGMACSRYDLYSLILCLFLTGLGLFLYRRTGIYVCFVWCTLIMAMRVLGKETAMRLYALFFGGAFILKTTLVLAGAAGQRSLIHNKYNLGFMIRRTLGQSHPNMLMITYLMFVLALYYVLPLKKRAARLFFAGLCLVFGIYFFLYSVSITGILCVALFAALTAVFGGRERYSLPEKALITIVLPLYVTVSLVIPLFLTGAPFDVIDRVSNTRYSQTREFLQTYGVHLFGLDMRSVTRYRAMDNSYLYAVMNFGSVVFLLANAALFVWIIDRIRKRKTRELIITLVCLTAGLSEPFLASLSFKNPVLMLSSADGFAFAGRLFRRRFGEESRLGCLGVPALYRLRLRADGSANSAAGLIRKARSLAARFLTCVREGASRHTLAVLSAAAAAAVIAGLAAWASYPMPEEVYCLRSECSEGEGYGLYNIFLDEEEAEAMREDKNVLLLNYGGPEDPLYRFSGASLGRTERIRAGISASLSAALAACVIISAVLGYNGGKSRNQGI